MSLSDEQLEQVRGIGETNRANAGIDVAGDVADQLAVINHNHRWLVRLRLIPRRPMPDPLWPRCDARRDEFARSLVIVMSDHRDPEALTAELAARTQEPDRWNPMAQQFDQPVSLAEFLLARTAAVASAWAEMDDQHAAHREWVLAECEAKRRIVELHREAVARSFCWTCANFDDEGEPIGNMGYPCPTLRLLALPYADHPDYQPEWRP